MYTYFGLQMSFFTAVPDSSFSDNFIIGLKSFSMKDNTIYTLSITGFGFETPTDGSSKFNELTILTFYTRNPLYVEEVPQPEEEEEFN